MSRISIVMRLLKSYIYFVKNAGMKSVKRSHQNTKYIIDCPNIASKYI